MAAPKNNSSVVTLRAKKTVATPPLILGFASLVEPDNYDPEKPTLKLNGHLTPEAITAFKSFMEEKVLTEAAIGKLRDNMRKETTLGDAKIDRVPVISAEDWLAAKLKDPKEGSRQQLPHLVIANRATYKARQDGELVEKKRVLGCWDGNNRKLDLRKLRLGMDSVIEAVVYGNLYFSKLDNRISPSLKLVGVKVLTLKRWGGGAAPPEQDEEAIREVLGEEFKMDDLAAYAAGSDAAVEEEPEDGADLTPEEQAKDLF